VRYFLPLLACGLLLAPQTAAAEPIHVQPRLVAGETRHYIDAIRYTLAVKGESVTIDMSMGMAISVDQVLDDGSARVSETIDSIRLDGPDAQGFQTSSLIGTGYSFVLHPDGSSSDFQVNGEDAPFASGATAYLSFPAAGLEVGQSYDTTMSVPIPVPGTKPLSMPVHTQLDALVTEQGRPAGRLVETMKLPESDLQIGPFGATGSGKMRGDTNVIYLMSLDTGWPLRADGVSAYSVTITAEKQQQTVDTRMEVHMAMDDEALSES